MLSGLLVWRRWSVRLLILAALSLGMADAVLAADTVTVRMRPKPVPFIDTSGQVRTQIVHFFLTVDADSIRSICRRRADIKSRMLVTLYNRSLSKANEETDLTVLAQDLFRVMSDQFGKSKVVAIHLALGKLGLPDRANKVQQRLEQVEDCTLVRTIPRSAVSATLQDLQRAENAETRPRISLPTPPSPIQVPRRAPATATSNGPSKTPQSFTVIDIPGVTPPTKNEFDPIAPLSPSNSETPMGKLHVDGNLNSGDCDLEIRALWHSGWVTIEGTRFWISQIRTTDPDDDGKANDVRFSLTQANGTEFNTGYLDLHPAEGGVSIPGLTLPDSAMLARLCLGSQIFAPPDRQFVAPRQTSKPNLAAEVTGRLRGQEQSEPIVVVDDGAADFWRWIAAIVSLSASLLAVAVIVGFMVHSRRDRRRKADRRRKSRRAARERRGNNKQPTKEERRKANGRRDKTDRREENTRRAHPDRRN